MVVVLSSFLCVTQRRKKIPEYSIKKQTGRDAYASRTYLYSIQKSEYERAREYISLLQIRMRLL